MNSFLKTKLNIENFMTAPKSLKALPNQPCHHSLLNCTVGIYMANFSLQEVSSDLNQYE